MNDIKIFKILFVDLSVGQSLLPWHRFMCLTGNYVFFQLPDEINGMIGCHVAQQDPIKGLNSVIEFRNRHPAFFKALLEKLFQELLRSNLYGHVEITKTDFLNVFLMLTTTNERAKEVEATFDDLTNFLCLRKAIIYMCNHLETTTLQRIFFKMHMKVRNDKEIMTLLIRRDGSMLRYCCQNLQDDKDLVMLALERNGNYLQHASDRLRKMPKIVMKAFQKTPTSLVHAAELLKDDEVFILAAIQVEPHALSFASTRLKTNKEIVMAAIQKDGSALEHASAEFQDDKEIVLQSVTQYGKALRWASIKLQDDDEVVSAAMKHDTFELFFASERLYRKYTRKRKDISE